MSMPAAIFDDEDSPPIDPDDLKMPESPQHRRASDLIGLVAANLLGPDHEVFRDMNWYPADGGPAMAPDVMVLPAGAWVPPPNLRDDEPLKSYRQDLTDGPAPSVVVEVPSASDGFVSLLAKAERCQRLGAAFYLVNVFGPQSVLRFGPDRLDSTTWLDQPVPELGGLRIDVDGDDLVVILPDGTRARSDDDLLAQIQHRADTAEARADTAEERAAALARQLRALGVEPDT